MNTNMHKTIGVSEGEDRLSNDFGFDTISIFKFDYRNLVREFCEKFELPLVDLDISFTNTHVVRRHGTYFTGRNKIRIYRNTDGTSLSTLLHELGHHLQMIKFSNFVINAHDSFFTWAHIEIMLWMNKNRQLLQIIAPTITMDAALYEKLNKVANQRK